MSDPKQFYVVRMVNDDTQPDAIWLIGPFAEELVASAWATDHLDDMNPNWQLLGLTDAEVSRPLRLVVPADAEERQRARTPAEELILHRLDPGGRDH